ncbi:MAG TPA: PBP1A family penicillin-binding protein [Polyangiaceae bacterium]|nr:PBP1A family penicillin-binding protein [Polyangiaceae bacterium]
MPTSTPPFDSRPIDGPGPSPTNGREASLPGGGADSPSSSGKPRASRRRRRLMLALKVLGFGALGVVVAAFVGVWLVLRHYSENLPSIGDLKGNYNPPQMTRVLARDGTTLLAEIFTERRTVVSIGSLPAHVKLAVLAAEDAGFYEHEGLDYYGMTRALIVNVRSGRTRQGGSTITQQVVKNILLDPERSFRRKMRELILARRLEQQISKDEILELYLNHIYFGHGRYGIEEAARYYFGKSAREITLAEGAMLAGLPAGPELYSPRHDAAKARTRRAFVLAQMLDKGFIDQRQHDAAMAEPVRLAPPVEPQGQLAPEVVELVKRTLKEVAIDSKRSGGYTVTTTIDPRLQAAARKAVRDNLGAYDKRYKLLAPFAPPAAATSKATATTSKKKSKPVEKAYEGMPRFSDHKVLIGAVVGAEDTLGMLDVRVGAVSGSVKLADYERYNPQHLPPSQFAPEGTLLRVSLLAPADGSPENKVPLRLEMGPEAAMVALDVRTHEVLALIGSYEGASGALDRATQAHRQPGSSFKPFVYGYALSSRRFTPASLLETSPGSLIGYRPSNFEDSEGIAPTRLREALAHSVNVSAVHVLEDVGPANVVTWAAALGIQSKLGADLSLALGSYEVTPYEMATAFATLASGGIYEAPVLVTRIAGPDGKELPLPPRPPSRRVIGEAEAYLTTSVLMSVVDHGTAASARSLRRPVAGKTGTSNQAKDTWFVGYSADIVCATWTGYDDGRPLGGREQGATTALPAWIAFMRDAHEKRPATEFPRPAGLVALRIDPRTGLLAYDGEDDAIEELFLQGTEPQTVSTPSPVAADGGTAVTPGAGLAEGAEVPASDGARTDGGRRQGVDPPPF